MLREIAVADAYGAAFEFTTTPDVANDLSGFGAHPTGTLPRGAYTDDTLRAMANARVMLDGDPFDPRHYAAAYLEARRADRRSGWSRRFERLLDEHLDAGPEAFMRAIRRGPTNGCVMGVAVLGLLPDEGAVRLAATMQTVSTHAAAAVPYAQVVALAAHRLVRGDSGGAAVEAAIAGAEWAGDGQRRRFSRMVQDPPTPAMPAETIAAGALWSLAALDGLAGTLVWSCSRGGDTDSLAAVSVGLGSLAGDVARDLPSDLLEGFDDAAGRRRVAEMDDRLAALVARG